MAYTLTANDVELLFCVVLLNIGTDTTSQVLTAYNKFKNSNDVLERLDALDKGTRVEDNKIPSGVVTIEQRVYKDENDKRTRTT